VIVIAGTGRSGTSFLARLFQNFGMNIGTGPTIGFRKTKHSMCGGEDASFVKLNRRLANDPESVEPEKLRKFAEKHDVVKDPYFCYVAGAWLAAGSVELVVVSRRNLRASAESAFRSGLAIRGPDWVVQRGVRPEIEEIEALFKSRLAKLDQALAKHRAKSVDVVFPRSVQDFEYVYSLLSPHLDVDRKEFLRAWEGAREEDLVP
jgi:hypothetical protein